MTTIRTIAVLSIAALVAIGCGNGSGSSSAEDVAVRAVEAGTSARFGAFYDEFHPDLKAQSSRTEFIACASEEEPAGMTGVDIESDGSFVEDGATFVDVLISDPDSGGQGSLTVKMLESDGRWWVADVVGGQGRCVEGM